MTRELGMCIALGMGIGMNLTVFVRARLTRNNDAELISRFGLLVSLVDIMLTFVSLGPPR